MLARMAISHPDPTPGEYAVSRQRDSGQGGESGDQQDVALSSINCVRGVVARAIKAFLFEHPERLGDLKTAIDSLLNDPHAAVRAAAIGLALPLYNIERVIAVDMFLRGCSHADDHVLQAFDLNHFLRYTILDFAESLRSLIERMVKSRDPVRS